MRRAVWTVVAIAAAGTLVLAARNALPAPRETPPRGIGSCALVGTHCGCKASANGCSMPCSVCCGPHGMADCMQNPTCCARKP